MATIEELAWLEGTWRGGRGSDTVEEIWSAPLGPCLAGVFRWIRGDGVYLYEIFCIEADAEGLALRIRHLTPGLGLVEPEEDPPAPWRLVRLEDREAVFEDPDRSFPCRLVYRRDDDSTLVVRLEGERNGDAAEIEFRFRRQG